MPKIKILLLKIITVESRDGKIIMDTIRIKSLMTYERQLNKFFESPLKRQLVLSVYVMTQSKNAIEFKTKNGHQKGLVLNYDDLIDQGWKKNTILEALKALIEDKFLKKVAIYGNKQLLIITQKTIDVLKKFQEIFDNDKNESKINFGSQKSSDPDSNFFANPYKVKKEKLKENILKNNEYQNNHENKQKDETECSDCFSLKKDLYSYDPDLDIKKQTIDDEVSACGDLYSYDPELDINKLDQNEEYDLEKNRYSGTRQDFVDTVALGDDLTNKQLSAIQFYAEQNNLDSCSLYNAVTELNFMNNYSSFHVLISSAIDALEAIEKENSSYITIDEKDITSKATKPIKIDYYGIQHAEIKRDGKLTEKQEHAIHSLLDFLQRKCKITFDYQKYFKWIYFQMVNPCTHFVRCNFQRAIGIVRKIISKGDYKEPYGYKEC